jgi:hypothetical protein
MRWLGLRRIGAFGARRLFVLRPLWLGVSVVLVTALSLGCSGHYYGYLKSELDVMKQQPKRAANAGLIEARFCARAADSLYRHARRTRTMDRMLGYFGIGLTGLGTVSAAGATTFEPDGRHRPRLEKVGVFSIAAGAAVLSLRAYVDLDGDARLQEEGAASIAYYASEISRRKSYKENGTTTYPFGYCIDHIEGVIAGRSQPRTKNE